MKYNVGDQVKIKSRKEIENLIEITDSMLEKCGPVVTIKSCLPSRNSYLLSEDSKRFLWSDEMIEGLVEEETTSEPKFKIGEVVYVIDYDTDLKIQNRIYKNGIWNYIINIESAPFIFYDNELKKKKEYPKTYEECCKILGFENTEMVFEDDYRDINPPKEQWKRLGLMNQLNKLLICRDAYWKIAGEEMGLGKPWEPDCDYNSPSRYVINCYFGDIIKEKYCGQYNRPLSFPTAEMRDAFKENFDPDIEICKEFL